MLPTEAKLPAKKQVSVENDCELQRFSRVLGAVGMERVEVAKTVESKRTFRLMLAIFLKLVHSAIGCLCSERFATIAVSTG